MLELSEITVLNDLLAESDVGSVILLDFSAQWCGPCKRVTPLIEKMDEEFQSVTMFKIDVDEADPTLLERYEIQAMPTFIILKKLNQQEFHIARVTGADAAAVRLEIEKLLC